MIDPNFLSITELAERWKQTPRQIIDHGLSLRLPLLFMFDGLAFDFSDDWHRNTGAHMEKRELERLQKWIEDSRAHIQRNAAGLTGEFDRMESHEVIQLRKQIVSSVKRSIDLMERLEDRELQRRKKEYRGLMRAMPDTLWNLQMNDEIAFPHMAMHPLSPVRLAEFEEKQHWDGRIMVLEPGLTGRWKERLNANDLLIPMQFIRALEVEQESDTADLSRPPARQQVQEQAILHALRQMDFEPLTLPPHTPKGGAKAAVKRLLMEKRKDLFTESSFKKTWEALSGRGEIAYKEN
jgi:hypothetical protein